MNSKKKKLFSVPETKTGFVFLCIWLGLAIICLVLGVGILLSELDGAGITFSLWMGSGLVCVIPVIGTFIPFIRRMTRQGRSEGANNYTVSESYGTVTVQNHPFLYALVYFLVAIALSVLVGLPTLLIFTIIRIILMIKWIVRAAKAKKEAKISEE